MTQPRRSRVYAVFLVCIMLIAPLLGGCASTIVGAAATTGIAAAQERSMGDAIDDQFIGLSIRNKWSEELEKPLLGVDITVTEGVVLLTGRLADPDVRVDAVRLAWQAQGVERVINEISLTDEGGGIIAFARDTRIANELRLRLTGAKDVYAINYTIDTVDRVVYLMGVAQNEAELNRVVEIGRAIGGVERVVSYVRVKQPDTAPDRKTAQQATASP